MKERTLALLDSALDAMRSDLSARAEELATKSSLGTLSEAERLEYAELVRLSDSLSLIRLQADGLLALRAAS